MQKAILPKLRFPEFCNAPAWEIKQLGETAAIQKGQQLNRSNMVSNGKYYVWNGGVSPSGKTDDWNRESNTITISEGGNSCGFVNYYANKFWCGGHCYTLSKICKQIYDKFLYHHLKSKESEIMQLRVGSGLPNIQKSNIEQFKVQYPHLEEQQKIAACLSSIDEVIRLEGQKLEALCDHKKGLLQNLFPAEGETLPKFRFPEFCNDLEGIEFKTLKEVVYSIKTGLNPRENFVLNSTDASNFYVTVKEITTSKIIFSKKTDKINDNALKVIQKRSNLEIGDILFSGIGTIGKVALVDIPTNNWNCSESVFIIKPIKEIISSKFLSYILGSKIAKNQYQGQSVGSALKGVRMSTLSLIQIPIPPLAMQQKIAACLSSLDDTITAQTKKIEVLKEHKKGLLQQLFPNLEEVTR